MTLKTFLILFLFFTPLLIKSQTSAQLSSAEIKQGLEGLDVIGSVLYIAAHPDDENTRLLAYLSKEKKVRTGYLSLTRGDGGQNLIGNEQGDVLGLIRTQELLAARRMDGAEQFFTRAIDFGFSKNPEESFKIWDKQKVLSDVVWVIRKFHPDIIITRFPEDSRAGHGHHSASAILAREAFLLAADPKQFPEQLAFVKPWQAKRVVWNTFNFGGTNTTSDSQLQIDVGLFNSLIGKSYGELAAESRSNHKSQGFGTSKQRGSAMEFFIPIAGSPAKKDLFEGVDLQWNRLNGGIEISRLIQKINLDYQISKPEKSVPRLVEILTAVEKIKDEYWKTEKIKKIKDLIVASSGLWFESYAKFPQYAIRDSISVSSQVIVRTGNEIFLNHIGNDSISMRPYGNENEIMNFEQKILASKISHPYWLKEQHPTGTYTFKDPTLSGYPENPDVPGTKFVFNISGKLIQFERPIVFKMTDPVRGEIYQPLIIAPPITATLVEKAFVFNGKTTKTILIKLKSFKDLAIGSLQPNVPAGWKITPKKIDVKLFKKGDEQIVKFMVTPAGEISSGVLSINVHVDDQTYHESLQVLKYDHIPVQTLFPLTEARVEQVDLKFAGKNIGYLAGSGDLIPECLKQIGYNITLLNENQVLTTDLSAFDAIILGVRLYNINTQADVMQPKLMNYVKDGGTLLVQYNVNAGLKTTELGPYPFKLSRNRVTEEDAKVTFLAPNHPALNFPNKITNKDFEGWIQERGLYFATDADPKYIPILSMHDTGEQASDGSLLVADYGKGKFVYTSLVFFRELPAGVPGAYRLFVNLISNDKIK